MTDARLDAARKEGRGPRAPAYVGWWVSLGGLTGAGLGAASVDWRGLAAQAFGLTGQTPSLTAHALPVIFGCTLGALLGLVGGQLTLATPHFALRGKAQRSAAPKQTGLTALLIGGVVVALLPSLLPAVTHGDPGRAIWITPVAVLIALLVAMLPLAAWSRARARARFKEIEAPWPPPRRDEDAMPPEVKAALAASRQGAPIIMDRVITDGVYAAAIIDDPPTLVAHGGAHLIALAEDAGVPVIVDKARAATLAAIPTGGPITR